ncbi:MAG: response regulator [Planctomycetota bacterium]|nr:response regulator [Planctomycetota bacterium]
MKKHKVMVVDDEAIVRESVSEWLAGAEFDVSSAEDGDKALDALKRGGVDAMVLDWKMPGRDGISVLREVRRTEPQTRVIIVTAYGTVQNAVEALKIGASDYMLKPFEPAELEKVLRRVLGETTEMKVTEVAAPVPETIVREAVKPAAPAAEKTATTEKVPAQKQCIWAKAGVVSYRLCANNFKCEACDFAQALADGKVEGAAPGAGDMLKKLAEKPGAERHCRYMLSGDVNFKLCPNVYQCYKCNYDQQMQEQMDRKMAGMMNKIKARVTLKK